jgi:hypothetical protein
MVRHAVGMMQNGGPRPARGLGPRPRAARAVSISNQNHALGPVGPVRLRLRTSAAGGHTQWPGHDHDAELKVGCLLASGLKIAHGCPPCSGSPRPRSHLKSSSVSDSDSESGTRSRRGGLHREVLPVQVTVSAAGGRALPPPQPQSPLAQGKGEAQCTLEVIESFLSLEL